MSNVDLALSNGSLINTLSQGLVSHSVAIKHQRERESTPDLNLIKELEELYEIEKAKLEAVWLEVKEKGEDFLKEVLSIVKDYFEEAVADLLRFLTKHGLQIIVDFLKEIF